MFAMAERPEMARELRAVRGAGAVLRGLMAVGGLDTVFILRGLTVMFRGLVAVLEGVRRSCRVGGTGGERSESRLIGTMGSSNKGRRIGISKRSSSSESSESSSIGISSASTVVYSNSASLDRFDDRLGRGRGEGLLLSLDDLRNR